VVSVEQSTTVYDTVELMNKRGVAAVVITEAAKPLGIFTERDVLKRVATKLLNIKETAVKQVMTAPIVTMPQTALISDVLAEMHRRDIRNMPVSGPHGALTCLVAMPEVLQYAQAFNIDEQVRRSWKEVAEYLDTEDQYTPG
jgi:signal-transduction protein with cAMP-binding, CBS, and nucleotidyltransferase domain